MLHFVIVEDDLPTAKTLQSYVKKYALSENLEIRITTLHNAEQLIHTADQLYDLILLDIQLPGIDGMEAAKRLRKQDMITPIIFITNLAQYAVKGYEVDALDFIVKPASYQQLSMKLQKALRIINRRTDNNIAITVDRNIRFISSLQLMYIEVIRHDLHFHLADQKVLRCRGSLSKMEEQLSGSNFIRISSCYLVNMEYISGLTPHSVIIFENVELTISRALRKNVLSKLTSYIGGSI